VTSHKKTTLLTRPELAKEHGVHPGTITRWERDGMPVAKRAARGRPTLFDKAEVAGWKTAVDQVAESGQARSLEQERAVLAHVQGERIMLQNAVRKGEVLEVAAVSAIVTEMFTAVKTNLLALPSAVAEELVSLAQAGGVRAVEHRLREAVTAALKQLSSWRPPWYHDTKQEASSPAPAKRTEQERSPEGRPDSKGKRSTAAARGEQA
jgi:phage terminase Nu1 subunit (DNA packaging protein)